MASAEGPNTMSMTKPLLVGDITLSDAIASQQAMLSKLKWPGEQRRFFQYLKENSSKIRSVISNILGVKKSQCLMSTDTTQWLRGSFNVCIPVQVDDWEGGQKKLFAFRVTLPYKVGEEFNPGNIDEKIRSEAGTYVWIKNQCPEVPLPKLWGFGLTRGNVFAMSDSRTRNRTASFFKSFGISGTREDEPNQYLSLDGESAKMLRIGFMLLDFVGGPGIETLGWTWRKQYRNKSKRTTFFRDLAKIMLSLARAAHTEIASLCFNDNCTVTFTNRPMTSALCQIENEGVSIPIQRHNTYNHCSAYVSDLLRCHDNWLENGPNSASSQGDMMFQASVIAALRTIQPTFLPDDCLRGPFYMTLTDLHAGNIFVDDDWHIKCIIDLEWAGTRPLNMIHPPDWLCGMGDNMLNSSELSALQAEFIGVLQDEEDRLLANVEIGCAMARPPALAQAMRTSAENGAFWYFSAVTNHSLATFIWTDHLMDSFYDTSSYHSTPRANTGQPAIADSSADHTDKSGGLEASISSVTDKDAAVQTFSHMVCNLWRRDLSSTIEKKRHDRADYVDKLRRFFASNGIDQRSEQA